jgi:chromosomal replication initiator protein
MTGGGWEAIREAVRLRIGPSTFEAWFGALSGRIEEGALVLGCPDRFSRDWIRSRYGTVIQEVAPAVGRIEYRVDPELGVPRAPRERGARGPAAPLRPGPADPTFDTFVSGPSNALALEAARAVARGEAGPCSPLVLSGASGVGKTHLCRAIRSASPEGSVYRSAEEFTSEVTGAIRAGRMETVRQRYRRSLNVLILEDVQFLAGKRATQIEFFHTLDHLVSNGKRVVISADRLPGELEGIDERLRSRLAAGLVARIGPPELVTRSAILREKAAAGGVRVPDDCLAVLARRPVGSVRELLAGLNQVVAHASLLRAPVGLDLVREALEAVEVPGRPLSVEEVVSLVSGAYDVTAEELRSPSRRRRIVRPRQTAMYLCRRYTQASLHDIGRHFRRDHTSVRYAVDAVERRVLEQPQLRYELEAMAARLSPGLRADSGGGRTRGTRRT